MQKYTKEYLGFVYRLSNVLLEMLLLLANSAQGTVEVWDNYPSDVHICTEILI